MPHSPYLSQGFLQVNDTVGTLARGRFWNEDTMLGVILGTGTNACYVEQADAVSKWRDPPPKSGEMIINLEWGNFRSPHLPRTFADEEVDVESVNPGDQWFEKMVGGMYLGEIVRRVLAKIAQEAGLFGGSSSPKLFEPFSLRYGSFLY
jgi:hexokinase